MKEKTANTLLCQTGDSQKRMIIIEKLKRHICISFFFGGQTTIVSLLNFKAKSHLVGSTIDV
jgi:hypothetical protein